MIRESILDWVNGGLDETNDLALTNILSFPKAIWLRLRFTLRKQEKFLAHYLMIKGESQYSKESKEVINIMTHLYSEADTLDAPIMRMVLIVLKERIGEGLSLHAAMNDLFRSNFVMIMKASSVTRTDGDSSKKVAFNKAINEATQNAIEISKVTRNTRIKAILGVAAITLSFYVANAASGYYKELKVGDPDVDRFIEIPHNLYMVGELFNDYFPMFFGLFMLFIFAQRYAMNNWLGESRELLDHYWPPFIIHRYLAGLNIFSGLSLLIGHIGYESLKAVSALRDSANDYEKFHLALMRDKLGEGDNGTSQLDTGLLTKELQLTLRISGEGESSSIKTGLHIINTQGKEDLIRKLKYVSLLFMISMLFAAVWVLVSVGAASAFLFQTTLGF